MRTVADVTPEMRPSRNLARSSDGGVIHRADCIYARHPWNWADRATDDELLEAKLYIGLKVCKKCKPSLRRDERTPAPSCPHTPPCPLATQTKGVAVRECRL